MEAPAVPPAGVPLEAVGSLLVHAISHALNARPARAEIVTEPRFVATSMS
jgi:hypothetical protein